MEAAGPPSAAGRRLPPLRALRQNAPGPTRWGLKALSLVHCLQVASGFLATRFDCWSLHAERRKHKSTLYSSADVQHRGLLWETKMVDDVRFHVILRGLIADTWRDCDSGM